MYGHDKFIEVTNRRSEPVYVNVRHILTISIARFSDDNTLFGNITTERGSVITKQLPNEILKLIANDVTTQLLNQNHKENKKP
ncbi:MAG: hypothetical protein IJG84_21220 [Kiritimatiellae bacterium]|nr:hypothetical protein [Kiritimatiellia bacterium]